jgi:hypothetical protein
MSVILQCSCGKTLQVAEQYRGKKAKCPACGNILLVEDADTAIQTEIPAKSQVPSDDADEPEVRKPFKRPAAATKRSLLPWLAVGGCGLFAIFSCILCGGVGTWYFFFRGSDRDLAFVHADVTGFISIRVADAMKSPAVKDQMQLMPPRAKHSMDKKLASLEKKLGLSINDLERVTVIFRSVAQRDMEKEMGIVARTTKPIDRKKIFDLLDPEKVEKKHAGAAYFVFNGPGNPMALHFVNDRVVLMTENEPALKGFLNHAGNKPTHPALTRGLQLTSSGKHQIVAAFKLNFAILNRAFPPEDFLANLRSMDGLIATGTFDQRLALEFIGTFASSDAAARGKNDADAARQKALQDMQRFPMPNDGPQRMLAKLVQSMTIEQRGADIVIKAKTDVDLGPLADVLRRIDLRPPEEMRSVNNLKEIGLAMHNFHDVNKSLPNHAILQPQTGQHLLSWRVTILPYFDEGPLYNQIRRDEPWDSVHNRQFWNKMPKIYQLPGKPSNEKTYYQVFHGDESAFPKSTRPLRNFMMGGDVNIARIPDGTSNTIFVVEAAEPVNWMKPEDIPFRKGQQDLPNRLGNHWGDDCFNAMMGDASVRRMRRSLAPLTLEGLITRAGGEVVDERDWEP